jgi:tight adherence protein C
VRAVQRSEKLNKYANFLEPQNVEEYSVIKLNLVQAGYHSTNALRMYYLAQFTLGILGLVLGGAYALLKMQQGDVSSKDLMMMILIPAGAGYMGPNTGSHGVRHPPKRRSAWRLVNRWTNPSCALPRS